MQVRKDESLMLYEVTSQNHLNGSSYLFKSEPVSKSTCCTKIIFSIIKTAESKLGAILEM